MIVDSFDPKSQVIKVSESAIEHLCSQLEKNPDKVLRLSVKESGCTGYKYELDLADVRESTDLIYALNERAVLYIDSNAVSIVKGTEIDYVIEGANKQLKFLNPNAKDYCGCGESFSIG